MRKDILPTNCDAPNDHQGEYHYVLDQDPYPYACDWSGRTDLHRIQGLYRSMLLQRMSAHFWQYIQVTEERVTYHLWSRKCRIYSSTMDGDRDSRVVDLWWNAIKTNSAIHAKLNIVKRPYVIFQFLSQIAHVLNVKMTEWHEQHGPLLRWKLTAYILQRLRQRCTSLLRATNCQSIRGNTLKLKHLQAAYSYNALQTFAESA